MPETTKAFEKGALVKMARGHGLVGTVVASTSTTTRVDWRAGDILASEIGTYPTAWLVKVKS